jgi:acetyl esterase/lipase
MFISRELEMRPFIVSDAWRRTAALFAVIMMAAAHAVAAPVVPESGTWQEAIEYAAPDGTPLLLNLAAPRDGAGPFPAIVCIHGGGFRAGKRESHDALCVKLAERGYVAATVSYRLAPDHRFPAAVHDVKAAVRWLRAHAADYRIDPTRIGALGASAGGSLAQLLGVTAHVPRFEGEGGNLEQPSDVACVVNIYGANDFTKSYGRSKDAHVVLPLWFGGDLSTHRARHIEGSPLFWVTPAAAPTRCIHGTEDDHVALEQSQWLVERLVAAAVPADLVVLEGAGHGFKGADATRAEQAIFTFFDTHLKPTASHE